MLLNEVDTLFCLNIRESYPYAVASAYRNWYDLEDEDVVELMAKK
jgi:predicted phosphoribosyltransferase